MSPTEFVHDRQIYERVVLELIPNAERFVWIATSDLKDLHVERRGRRRYVPFLETLAELSDDGVSLRLIHAKEPGPAFRHDFDRYPELIEGLERLLCPRVHLKTVVVDGAAAYLGSANLTGAGMGAKSDRRRNFEAGIVSDEPALIEPAMEQFDAIWRGDFCEACGRREFCAEVASIEEGE